MSLIATPKSPRMQRVRRIGIFVVTFSICLFVEISARKLIHGWMIAALIYGLLLVVYILSLRRNAQHLTTSSQISPARVNTLLGYCFLMVGAAGVVLFHRTEYRGLLLAAFLGSIPVFTAIVAGWPERSRPESS